MRRPQQPRLLYFYSTKSGPCRRTEAFLAQLLQRRHNHDTFDLVRVSVDLRPDLAERLRVDRLPTLLVVDDRVVRARLTAPKGIPELEAFLRPWLRKPTKRQPARASSISADSANGLRL